MILLGTAQTYFGVLLTLAVLQLFYQGKNCENYFLKLVEQLGNDILNVADSRVNSLESTRKEEIKTLSELQKEEIVVVFLGMQVKVMDAREKLEDLLKASTMDETPMFVAFYSFLFGLVIMLLDPFWTGGKFLVGFILYYITLSFSFTVALWYMYIKNPCKDLNDSSNHYVKPNLKVDNTCWYLIFAFTVLFVLFSLMPFVIVWLRMLVTFIVFMSMGFCLPYYNTVNYNRRFVLRHALLIFIISLFGGFLYHVSPYCSYAPFDTADSLEMFVLRFLLIVFMLGNLIIIPLLIISVRHYWWKITLEREIDTEDRRIRERIQSLISDSSQKEIKKTDSYKENMPEQNTVGQTEVEQTMKGQNDKSDWCFYNKWQHVENLFYNWFNFFLVLYGVFIAAIVTLQSVLKYKIDSFVVIVLVAFAIFILSLVWIALCRNYQKLMMKMYDSNKDFPVSHSLQIFSNYIRGRIIGRLGKLMAIIIPACCLMSLYVYYWYICVMSAVSVPLGLEIFGAIAIEITIISNMLIVLEGIMSYYNRDDYFNTYICGTDFRKILSVLKSCLCK